MIVWEDLQQWQSIYILTTKQRWALEIFYMAAALASLLTLSNFKQKGIFSWTFYFFNWVSFIWLIWISRSKWKRFSKSIRKKLSNRLRSTSSMFSKCLFPFHTNLKFGRISWSVDCSKFERLLPKSKAAETKREDESGRKFLTFFPACVYQQNSSVSRFQISDLGCYQKGNQQKRKRWYYSSSLTRY